MVKHHLQIHVDHQPGTAKLRLAFSYPFSGDHQLSERAVQVPTSSIPDHALRSLTHLLDVAKSSIPLPASVRLPHATVTPAVRLTMATLVVQDQTQEYPALRQLYVEEHADLEFHEERQVRMSRADFSKSDMAAFQRFAQWAKGEAWARYTVLVGDDLHP